MFIRMEIMEIIIYRSENCTGHVYDTSLVVASEECIFGRTRESSPDHARVRVIRRQGIPWFYASTNTITNIAVHRSCYYVKKRVKKYVDFFFHFRPVLIIVKIINRWWQRMDTDGRVLVTRRDRRHHEENRFSVPREKPVWYSRDGTFSFFFFIIHY